MIDDRWIDTDVLSRYYTPHTHTEYRGREGKRAIERKRYVQVIFTNYSLNPNDFFQKVELRG